MENLKIDTDVAKGEMLIGLDWDDDEPTEHEIKFNTDGYIMYGQEHKHKLRVEVTLRHDNTTCTYVYNRGSTRLDITDAVKERIERIILDAWEQRLLTDSDYLKKQRIEYFNQKIKDNEDEIKDWQNSVDVAISNNRKYQRAIDDLECGI